jgi:hypothetical protein
MTTTVTEMIKELCMDRNRLKCVAVMQEGAYGRVYKGLYTSPTADKGQQVLIKTVTSKLLEKLINFEYLYTSSHKIRKFSAAG